MVDFLSEGDDVSEWFCKMETTITLFINQSTMKSFAPVGV
jgi:hypothetical protein